MRRVVALLVALALAGCGTGRPAGDGPAAARVAPDPLAPATHVAGHSREGRAITYEVHGDGPETIVLIAGIHGDEPAGGPLFDALSRRLQRDAACRDGRRIVLLARANPDGLANGTRHNAAGVDLNRNFPAANFRASHRHGPAALSEPESRVLEAVIDTYAPVRVLSLHQPLACVDWDGDGEALARAMAACCDLPAKKLGGRPGSLGSWVSGERATPIITLELPKNATGLDAESLWERYGNSLIAFILHPRTLKAATRIGDSRS